MHGALEFLDRIHVAGMLRWTKGAKGATTIFDEKGRFLKQGHEHRLSNERRGYTADRLLRGDFSYIQHLSWSMSRAWPRCFPEQALHAGRSGLSVLPAACDSSVRALLTMPISRVCGCCSVGLVVQSTVRRRNIPCREVSGCEMGVVLMR